MTMRIAAAALAALVLGAFPAAAQETPTAPAETAAPELVFQLNNAETRDGSCQLTFVVENRTGTVIQKSVYSMAIIDTEGAVSQLLTLEFKPLPIGRPKIQSFGIPQVPCESISAISINDFNDCVTDAGDKQPICESAIKQSSRIPIEFPWTL